MGGPLISTQTLEVSPELLDAPQSWLDRSLDEILRFRFSLLRGKSRLRVEMARSPTGFLSTVQEAAMASRPSDTELWLKKKPSVRLFLSPREAPYGPSGVVERVLLAENPHVPRAVEETSADKDLRAEPGVAKLYSEGISQTQITRVFSVGLLGQKSERRLVPTEWSITAVDDILGRHLRDEIIDYQTLGEFRLYSDRALSNSVHVLLTPTTWMYEALEGWMRMPATVASDFELFHGRSSYPSNLGGAYHAARLPILEYLAKIRRQAGALAFLEVGKEWIPLGVWRFREICRRAMSQKPAIFSSLDEALGVVERRVQIPFARWVKSSRLIPYLRHQRTIRDFFKA